ncbi:hypothetical protein SEVIR_4G064201v4 [Setaria viridis]
MGGGTRIGRRREGGAGREAVAVVAGGKVGRRKSHWRGQLPAASAPTTAMTAAAVAPDGGRWAGAPRDWSQSFLLSYGVRVGIGILLHAFKLVRRRSFGLLLDLDIPIVDCGNDR